MYNQISNFNIVMPDCGKSIEESIREQLESKAPIEMVSERIYTERKDGVNPAYDIRTDRFDLAIKAHDIRSKAAIARRMEEDKPSEEQQTEEGA